ncbi:MAG TPA: hypothetical protein VG225_07540 [Terracidiphilus sp.]|jgi:hypothetical protein|nr:hypothetical protein [Terracidiphilus sp.]
MFSKTYLAAGFFLAASSLAVASTAIGTASTRGDIRVDGYAVSGNATLFDGTAVETSQATATLRLDKGTQIKLGTGTLGTLYRDHMILQHGKSELASSNSYQLQASGFHVTASEPNSRGVVTVNELGAIQVAAISGSFQVTNGNGLVLAKVVPGTAQSFSSGAAGGGDQGGNIGSDAGLKGATIVVLGGVAGIFLIEEGIYHANKSPASR